MLALVPNKPKRSTPERIPLQPMQSHRPRRLSRIPEELQMTPIHTKTKTPTVKHLPPEFILRSLKAVAPASTPHGEHRRTQMEFQVIDLRLIVRFPARGLPLRSHQVEILEAAPLGNNPPVRFPNLTKFFPPHTMNQVDYQIYRNPKESAPYTYILFHNRAAITANIHFQNGANGDVFVTAVKNPERGVWNDGVFGAVYADVPWSVESRTFNYHVMRNVMGTMQARHEKTGLRPPPRIRLTPISLDGAGLEGGVREARGQEREESPERGCMGRFMGLWYGLWYGFWRFCGCPRIG